MSYLVLARKYRPKSFAEMAGQAHVVRTLTNALKSGHLAHAYLFTGPRGVGKTTSARLVARCLNCERGPTAEPCGTCAPCVEIAEGRSVDVVEIDAASNNGVDNVRDIVEGVKYRPARDRFKVYVVDEVHMLSQGAFNALLKTLEEPPPHVTFVLATTDVHKVPETIVSRCQRFDFRRLTRQQIIDQLRHVAEAEKLAISDAALAVVARAAEGGMRDALSMLDQVRAACGDSASDAEVAEAVGAIDPGAVGRLAAALVRRDGAALLEELAAVHARGFEMKRLAEELVRHLRDLVVAKLVPQAPLDLPDGERDELRALAAGAPAAQLTRLFDLAEAAVGAVKLSEQPRYALEVALLGACFLAPGAEVSELVQRLEALSSGLPPPPSPVAPPARWAPPTQSPPVKVSPEEPPRPRPQGADEAPAVPLAERWRLAVAEVGKQSFRLAQALKQAVLTRLEEGVVALAVPPGMYLSTLEGGRAEVERIFASFFRQPTRLELTPAEKADAAPAGDAPSAPGGAPRSLAEVEQAARRARSAEVRAVARAHPRLEEARRILGAEVERIDEL